MAEITEVGRKIYSCRTCKTEFAVPKTETAVCCPICRMNRIKRIA